MKNQGWSLIDSSERPNNINKIFYLRQCSRAYAVVWILHSSFLSKKKNGCAKHKVWHFFTSHNLAKQLLMNKLNLPSFPWNSSGAAFLIKVLVYGGKRMWSSWAHYTKRLASVIVRTGSSASSCIATKGDFYFAAAAVRRCFIAHHSSLGSICETVQGTESCHDSPESSVGAGKRNRNWFWVIPTQKKPLNMYVCAVYHQKYTCKLHTYWILCVN